MHQHNNIAVTTYIRSYRRAVKGAQNAQAVCGLEGRWSARLIARTVKRVTRGVCGGAVQIVALWQYLLNRMR